MGCWDGSRGRRTAHPSARSVLRWGEIVEVGPGAEGVGCVCAGDVDDDVEVGVDDGLVLGVFGEGAMRVLRYGPWLMGEYCIIIPWMYCIVLYCIVLFVSSSCLPPPLPFFFVSCYCFLCVQSSPVLSFFGGRVFFPFFSVE